MSARHWSERLADERGSIMPSLPLFAMIVIIVGAILFQIGLAADLRAGTQTGADAAALAAAEQVGEEVVALLAEAADPEAAGDLVALPDPEELCELVDDGAINAAAEDYAGRNGTHVVVYERDCLEVAVSVESNGGVPGVAGLADERDAATADAAALVEIPDLPDGEGDAAVPAEDIVEIVEAGVELDVRLVE